MKNKLLIIFVSIALITAVFMYMDSAFFETKKSFFTYLKNMIYCGLLGIVVLKVGQRYDRNGGASNYESPPANSFTGGGSRNSYYIPHDEPILGGLPLR